MSRAEEKNCPFMQEVLVGATKRHAICRIWHKRENTHQFAVVVFAISTVLDIVCVRSLFLTQQPRKLGTAAESHGKEIKRMR